MHYGVTPLARRQLSDKLKIPYAYFERMREEQPVLLDRNVNTFARKPMSKEKGSPKGTLDASEDGTVTINGHLEIKP